MINIALLPFFILLGLLLYGMARPKISEIGRLTFFAAMLGVCLGLAPFAQHFLKIGH